MSPHSNLVLFYKLYTDVGKNNQVIANFFFAMLLIKINDEQKVCS